MAIALVRGKMIEVKNLRWLLCHWLQVSTFKVERNPNPVWDAILSAYNRDGVLIYQTSFGSSSVLWDFLNRPVFKGLPLDWFGLETFCGK